MWTRWAMGVAALAAAWAAPTSDALAGKKPGGGAAPATGTIYTLDLSTYEGSPPTYLYGSMDGNGGSRASLLRTWGSARPSRLLHGGKRWFLTSVRLPLFGVTRNDLIAVREDGAREVRLTANDGTMHYSFLDWAPDEDGTGATISMVARRWSGSTRDDTVVPGTAGLYTARLTFDGAGDVVGLTTVPAFRLSLGTVATAGGEQADASMYSWSPDMMRLAVQSWFGGATDSQIRVVDTADGAVTPLGVGDFPDWSPDGSKIAFRRWMDGRQPGFALQTASPDGSGVVTLLFLKQRLGATQSQYLFGPKWSPDAAHLAYQYVLEDNGSSWAHSIHRIAADGSGATNLTPEVPGPASGSGLFGRSLVGWR